MANKIGTLKNDIAEMEEVLNDSSTPAEVKKALEPAIKKAKEQLAELEKESEPKKAAAPKEVKKVEPKTPKKSGYKLGDMYSSDFDYEGMLKMGLTTNSTWAKKDLQKLYDSFEDVNYHYATPPLLDAIRNSKTKKETEDNLKKFHKLVKEELGEVEEVVVKKEEPKKKKIISDSLQKCKDLLAKYQEKKKNDAKRLQKRAEQGKPVELTPAETVKKSAQKVEAKVIDIVETRGGLKAAEINQLANGIISTIKSTLEGIEDTTKKHKFLKEIVKEIQDLEKKLPKAAANGMYMEDGGSIADSNKEMVMSNVHSIKHHADEIEEILNSNVQIEAWVSAKAERAATDLSDITHYLDGLVSKMAFGGMVEHNLQSGDKVLEVYKDYGILEDSNMNIFIYDPNIGERVMASSLMEAKNMIDSMDTDFRKRAGMFADGGEMADGGMMAKGGSTSHYNTGRSWHLDRARHNNSESWENKKKKFENGGRIEEMVEHWNRCGWAGSHINNDDSEFFDIIDKTPMSVSTTSFTGNDIKYYDEDRVDVTGGGFKQKFESGGTTDCGCGKSKYEDGGEMADGGQVPKNYIVEYEIEGVKHTSTYLLYPNDRVENLLPSIAKIISIKEKMDNGGMMAKGGEVSDKFEVGTPAVYHSFDYSDNPKEESGEIVIRDGVKGISLYPNRNYGGSSRNFIVPNWHNVETFYESNERQKNDIPFVIKDSVMMAKGGVAYNTGRSWHQDRARHNKAETWEKPLSQRKMETGGEMQSDREYYEEFAKDYVKKYGVYDLREMFLKTAMVDERSGDKETAKIKREIVKEYMGGQPKFMAKGGEVDESLTEKYRNDLYIAIEEANGFWYLISPPMETREKAERYSGGQRQRVVTLDEVKKHNKVIGREDLIYAKGGNIRQYKDLSLEKPLVVNDSKFEKGNVISKVKEVDLVKLGFVTISDRITQIRNSQDSINVFRDFWNENSINIQESFNVLLLNKANKPIGIYNLSKGGIDGTVADPELIAAMAIKTLAKGVIICHNHPSGNLQPSPADINISKKIKEGLKLFDISLLDSLIITEKGYLSFADDGYLERGGMMAKGGGLSRSQKQYNKEVDAYKYFIVDLKNKKAISGWEFREDANEALSDYDGDKNYKVVAEVTLKSLGIENPKESFKETVSKMAMGGELEYSYFEVTHNPSNSEPYVTYEKQWVGNTKPNNSKEITKEEYEHFSKYKSGGKMAMGGEVNKYVAVDEVNGYWYIISKPTTKENAQKQVTKSSQKVVTLFQAKEHKKVIGKEYLAMGGKVKFSDKVKAVKASLLKTKKVSPKVQKDYGKTYSPKEAEQAAKRIVGSRTAKWNERISKNK
jgi:DNA repair protein RadC